MTKVQIQPQSLSATSCCGLSPSPVLSPHSLINADFCVGSVCVAFGAVLGKVSPVQLLIMTLFQVTLFSINEYILLNLLEVSRAQNRDGGGRDTWGDRKVTEKEKTGETSQLDSIQV